MNTIKLFSYQIIFFIASFATMITAMVPYNHFQNNQSYNDQFHNHQFSTYQSHEIKYYYRPYETNDKKYQERLLRHAAKHNDIQQVKEIIQQGTIDLNSPENGTGNTALFWATAMDNVEIGNLLLEHGANVNVRNCTESTPLHIAIITENIKFVYLLLGYDADPSLKNQIGRRPDAYLTWHPVGETPNKGIHGMDKNHFSTKVHPILLHARLEKVKEEQEKHLLTDVRFPLSHNNF